MEAWHEFPLEFPDGCQSETANRCNPDSGADCAITNCLLSPVILSPCPVYNGLPENTEGCFARIPIATTSGLSCTQHCDMCKFSDSLPGQMYAVYMLLPVKLFPVPPLFLIASCSQLPVRGRRSLLPVPGASFYSPGTVSSVFLISRFAGSRPALNAESCPRIVINILNLLGQCPGHYLLPIVERDV